MTTRLRLVGSFHHGGMLYVRIERAGLTASAFDHATDTFEVEGDPQMVQDVIDRWNGEGHVEVPRGGA